MLVGAADGCRVWRDGSRLRIEHPDGRPIFITDGTQAWQFTADDAHRPRTGPLDRATFLGLNQYLLRRRNVEEWTGIEPSVVAGVEEVAQRRCWTVALTPLSGRPGPLHFWVDIESGHILGFRSDGTGEQSRYVDLTVGERLDDDLFTWSGQVFTPEEYEELLRERRLSRERERLEWFTGTITSSPITARVTVDFSPTTVSFHDPETGAFDAVGRGTMLARRPRSGAGWLPPQWGEVHYVWSTKQWDWAAKAFNAELDDESIIQLQQQLHPGEPVDRQQRIDSTA